MNNRRLADLTRYVKVYNGDNCYPDKFAHIGAHIIVKHIKTLIGENCILENVSHVVKLTNKDRVQLFVAIVDKICCLFKSYAKNNSNVLINRIELFQVLSQIWRQKITIFNRNIIVDSLEKILKINGKCFEYFASLKIGVMNGICRAIKSVLLIEQLNMQLLKNINKLLTPHLKYAKCFNAFFKNDIMFKIYVEAQFALNSYDIPNYGKWAPCKSVLAQIKCKNNIDIPCSNDSKCCSICYTNKQQLLSDHNNCKQKYCVDCLLKICKIPNTDCPFCRQTIDAICWI